MNADGTPDTGYAYVAESQGISSSGVYLSESGYLYFSGGSSRGYLTWDSSLGEGDTGSFTWYYRVNVMNNGNVISSDIGQLDVILEGINDGTASRDSAADPLTVR